MCMSQHTALWYAAAAWGEKVKAGNFRQMRSLWVLKILILPTNFVETRKFKLRILHYWKKIFDKKKNPDMLKFREGTTPTMMCFHCVVAEGKRFVQLWSWFLYSACSTCCFQCVRKRAARLMTSISSPSP